MMDVQMKLALLFVFAPSFSQTGFLEQKLNETGNMSPRRKYLFGTDFDDTLSFSINLRKGQCNFGRSCSKCPKGAYRVMEKSDVACCADCSKYFRSAYIDGSPKCTCDMLKYVDGDCWMGSKCDRCNNSVVGRINSIPICCPNCEMSGLHFSPRHCNCLHNGPGTSLWNKDYVEDSKINAATHPAEDIKIRVKGIQVYFVVSTVMVIKFSF